MQYILPQDIVAACRSYFRGWFSFVSTQAIDDAFDAMRDNFVEASYETLGIDKDDTVCEPLIVTGPRVRKQGGATQFYKKGSDSRVRYSLIDVLIMQLTKNHVCIYQCAFDMTTGDCLNPSTKEVFFKDIISIGILSDKKRDVDENAFWGIGRTTVYVEEKFEISLVSGEKIVVNLTGEKTNTEYPYMESLSKSITALRTLLRNKKSA